MADGVTQEQAKALAPDKAAEVAKLNLNPRQQRLLQQLLENYPTLTVQEAHQMMSEAGA